MMKILVLLVLLSVAGQVPVPVVIEAIGPAKISFPFHPSAQERGQIQLSSRVPANYSVTWTVASGPKTAKFSNPRSRTPLLLVEEYGDYVLLLTAADANRDLTGEGPVSRDELKIAVLHDLNERP